MSRHDLYNLTWACQNACPECWMRATVGTRLMREAATRPLDDWLRAVHRDPPDLIDVAGGEPLLVDWLPEFVRGVSPIRVGLSTNALSLEGILGLTRERLPNLVSLNLSYHPATRRPDYSIRFRAEALALKEAGYSVFVSVVDYSDNVERARRVLDSLAERGVGSVVSPYEEVSSLDTPMTQGLACKGGVNHLVVAPDGLAWPCLTSLRAPSYQETCLGNWLDGDGTSPAIDLSRKPQPCHLPCVDYYELRLKHPSGDMWRTEARPCALARGGA